MLILYLVSASVVAGAWVYWQRVFYKKDYGSHDELEIIAAVILGALWPIAVLPTVAIQAAKYLSDRRKR